MSKDISVKVHSKIDLEYDPERLGKDIPQATLDKMVNDSRDACRYELKAYQHRFEWELQGRLDAYRAAVADLAYEQSAPPRTTIWEQLFSPWKSGENDR